MIGKIKIKLIAFVNYKIIFSCQTKKNSCSFEIIKLKLKNKLYCDPG